MFLDEIANVAPGQQAKLLRVLQAGELERVGSSKTRKVDVRILAATNANLRLDVKEGRFREDLLFRLNTVEIRMPPLRERREDVPGLARHFLARHAAKYRKLVRHIAPAALDALLRHAWPGNVRELEHALERAVLLASGDTLGPADLGLGQDGDPGDADLHGMTLADAEAHLIQRALARSDGNVSDAARALGLSRSALYRRLEKQDR